MGMFGYMTDTETVEPLDTVDVESEGEKSVSQCVISTLMSHALFSSLKLIILFFLIKGDDMESLLFHFLDDWLYKFNADLFFVPRVSELFVCDEWINYGVCVTCIFSLMSDRLQMDQ